MTKPVTHGSAAWHVTLLCSRTHGVAHEQRLTPTLLEDHRGRGRRRRRGRDLRIASRPARREGPGREGDPHGPDLLRPLLLEVQRDRHGEGRRPLEDRGQPRRPALARPPLPARHRRRRRPLRHRPAPGPAPARQRPRRGEVDRGHLGRGARATSPRRC